MDDDRLATITGRICTKDDHGFTPETSVIYGHHGSDRICTSAIDAITGRIIWVYDLEVESVES